MKTSSFIAILLCNLGLAVATARGADAPPVINVWPGAVPGETGNIGPEINLDPSPGLFLPKQSMNVTNATLTIFRPDKDKDTGVAMLVLPGGGFRELEMDKEGEEGARWLNTLGITGLVLKYRVPERTDHGQPRYVAPLQDAQRAISLVRSKAAEWGLKPDKIGLLGFSAGANVAVITSTHFDSRSYPAVDAVDAVSCRPDFAVIVYPGSLINDAGDKLLPEVTVTKDTPQMFIVDVETDRVNSDNSTLLYLALKHANVPADLHIYTVGVHGFALRPTTNPHGTWPQLCADWLSGQGIWKSATAKP